MAAPPKKICLPPSRAGRKNVALHQHFEASGTVGRLRCKLCFQNWFEKQVAILRSEGKDENEAQAIVKGSVPQPQVFLCFFPPLPPDWFFTFARRFQLSQSPTRRTWKGTSLLSMKPRPSQRQ